MKFLQLFISFSSLVIEQTFLCIQFEHLSFVDLYLIRHLLTILIAPAIRNLQKYNQLNIVDEESQYFL